ncbi:MAG: hypothetical protein QOI83_1945 [Streptomycetaceae bacterium]|nr:hypothetical protein [Streptomycetaceae bacterium]
MPDRDRGSALRRALVAVLVAFISRPLPGDAALAAYRVVQEALTNAVKYAPGRRTVVEVAYDDEGVEIEVLNDGPDAVTSRRRRPLPRCPLAGATGCRRWSSPTAWAWPSPRSDPARSTCSPQELQESVHRGVKRRWCARSYRSWHTLSRHAKRGRDLPSPRKDSLIMSASAVPTVVSDTAPRRTDRVRRWAVPPGG